MHLGFQLTWVFVTKTVRSPASANNSTVFVGLLRERASSSRPASLPRSRRQNQETTPSCWALVALEKEECSRIRPTWFPVLPLWLTVLAPLHASRPPALRIGSQEFWRRRVRRGAGSLRDKRGAVPLRGERDQYFLIENGSNCGLSFFIFFALVPFPGAFDAVAASPTRSLPSSTWFLYFRDSSYNVFKLSAAERI